MAGLREDQYVGQRDMKLCLSPAPTFKAHTAAVALVSHVPAFAFLSHAPAPDVTLAVAPPAVVSSAQTVADALLSHAQALSVGAVAAHPRHLSIGARSDPVQVS